MTDRELIYEALKARENSYCPYSGFSVGAALLTDDGSVYSGCNIENAAFSPTNCAERTAIFKAVSEGHVRISKMAIAGGKKGAAPDSYTYPCGVCRQVMKEFASDDLEIIVAISEEDYVKKTLKDLLPESFGPENL